MRRDAKRYPIPLPEPCAKTLRLMWQKVKQVGACWEWTGCIHKRDGYPMEINVNGSRTRGVGKTYRPQRLFFHWFKYEIPDGLTIEHVCKNRKCVNPDHMDLLTHEENIKRANSKKFCKRGHPQTPENRYHYKANGVTRSRCKPCIPIQNRQIK